MRSRIMARLAPLMAMSALSSPAYAFVQGQPGVRAASPTVRLNVPAQPMKTALAEFALQSKQQLLYEPVIVEGKVSTAVVGNVVTDRLRPPAED
ncbi:MAG: hypothetical protein ABS87_00155 [Sphingomonas sp. SCN 67-18]|uniref:hypothetical protein n=1 Tax=uncultured Sphingomonas sp. TaxID=158754 RepID=UPI00086AB3F6|nr:hypothetical protein [Sphingomonas sp. SCN 67-18]ODU22852.1 MAG: hypothetical protein ABS87_00155 [Sphingomonas sp. SCN 67-18]